MNPKYGTVPTVPEFIRLVEDPDLVRHALGRQEVLHVRSEDEQLVETVPKRNEDTEMVLLEFFYTKEDKSYFRQKKYETIHEFMVFRYRTYLVNIRIPTVP